MRQLNFKKNQTLLRICTVTFITVIIGFFLVAFIMSSCTGGTVKKPDTKTQLTQEQKVKRGEYLVSIAACDDCHSPKRMGPNGLEIIPELRLSGYPSARPILKVDSNNVKEGWSLFGSDFTSAVGPWGMSFAANLTPDETGTGNWQEAQFFNAIRHGKYKGLDGSRDLLPPMPWFVYKNMTDEDLSAVFAYLRSLKPVSNLVPAPKTTNEIFK